MLRYGLAGLIILISFLTACAEIWEWPAIKLAERIGLLVFALFLYIRFWGKPHKERAWLLFPAGLAVVLAPILLWLDLHGWSEIAWFWPTLLFGPFLGLFQWYLFGKRQRSLIIPMTLFLFSASGLTWYNFTADNPLHASVWWPVFPFLFSIALHFVTVKIAWAHHTILASAGIILTCSLLFFSNTLFEIPYIVLWSFFLLSPLVGIGEVYFLRSNKIY